MRHPIFSTAASGQNAVSVARLGSYSINTPLSYASSSGGTSHLTAAARLSSPCRLWLVDALALGALDSCITPSPSFSNIVRVSVIAPTYTTHSECSADNAPA